MPEHPVGIVPRWWRALPEPTRVGYLILATILGSLTVSTMMGIMIIMCNPANPW